MLNIPQRVSWNEDDDENDNGDDDDEDDDIKFS